jgi:hypothetical protein
MSRGHSSRREALGRLAQWRRSVRAIRPLWRAHAVQRSDWALLAIAAAEGRPLTPVQLQKVLFILGREKHRRVGPGYYAFHPYNYGPFSSEIYADAEALDGMGLVDVEHGDPARSWSTYTATADGLARAQELRKKAPADAVRYLEALVAWARKLTFQQLVSSVYERYPDQRVNSIFVARSSRP